MKWIYWVFQPRRKEDGVLEVYILVSLLFNMTYLILYFEKFKLADVFTERSKTIKRLTRSWASWRYAFTSKFQVESILNLDKLCLPLNSEANWNPPGKFQPRYSALMLCLYLQNIGYMSRFFLLMVPTPESVYVNVPFESWV